MSSKENYNSSDELRGNGEVNKDKKLIDIIDRHRKFEYIQFTAGKAYAFSDFSLRFRKDAISIERATIPLGLSRYSGNWVDLPKGIDCPKGMEFVAQLDMSVFSQQDTNGWLPEIGQLYFFQGDYCKGTGGIRNKVFYTDVINQDLVRNETTSDTDCMILMENISAHSETFADRYCDSNQEKLRSYDEQETEWVYEGRVWSGWEFEGVSKVFGVYSHCQWDPNDIAEFSYNEENVLLLQIGEDCVLDENDETINGGFHYSGTLLVTIKKSDLLKLDFSSCQFEWADT